MGSAAAAATVFQPAERTRKQEWQQRALVEAGDKRGDGANIEEVQLIVDKG